MIPLTDRVQSTTIFKYYHRSDWSRGALLWQNAAVSSKHGRAVAEFGIRNPRDAHQVGVVAFAKHGKLIVGRSAEDFLYMPLDVVHPICFSVQGAVRVVCARRTMTTSTRAICRRQNETVPADADDALIYEG
eukprot:CAMPEP_0119205754 /NCGR_PEP_ID=MMETSP1316-20130426/40045_1 /TAXON_ID=41880 /ORGANISM="Pycnococcus provasolii, Strain RCC2336" /LENGTH=131 /DNA_ID=CAMNT_0007202147 /DNA_START=598 /DNA_END=993 /DNA_ORIENTATION=-